MVQIIGLTGPVQNGKWQLGEVFEQLGWVFYDLNDIVYNRRRKGMPRYDMYQELFPGSLGDDGVETGEFYRRMTLNTYRQFLSEDIPHVVEAAQVFSCDAITNGKKIVLSWEYMARIAPKLSLDWMLIFGSPRQRWYDRMKVQAIELGMGNLTDEMIDGIVKMLEVEPETIDREVRECVAADRILTLDVSPDDWGATELRLLIGSISE